MTLERAREIIGEQLAFGSGYNRNAVRLLLGEVQREHGLAAADRLILEKGAKSLQIPLVHGALAGFDGQVMTVFPEDQGLRLIYGKNPPPGKDPRSPEAILGVPALMPCLIGTLEAMEVLKILLGRGKLLRNTLLHVDLQEGEMNRFVFA